MRDVHRINWPLLNNGAIKDLSYIERASCFSCLLKVVMKWCIENAELCVEVVQIFVEVVDGVFPILSNSKKFGNSGLGSDMLNKLCNKCLVNMLDSVKSEAFCPSLVIKFSLTFD